MSLSGTADGYATKIGNEEAVSGGFDFKLTSFDKDYVYIGMFASRNADVTFRNIKLIVNGEEIYDMLRFDTNMEVMAILDAAIKSSKSGKEEKIRG